MNGKGEGRKGEEGEEDLTEPLTMSVTSKMMNVGPNIIHLIQLLPGPGPANT